MTDQPHAHAGRLTAFADVLSFILGGNARFTLVSVKTGARFTYRASRPDPVPGKPRPTWFSLLNGADNEANYAFIGTLWPSSQSGDVLTLKPSAKSKVSADATSVKALTWFLTQLSKGTVPAEVEVWHEGRCGRCGRTLTVPESIANGFGPECIQYVRVGGA